MDISQGEAAPPYRDPKYLYGEGSSELSLKTEISIHRKNLTETFNASVNYLDEASTVFLLEKNLTKYCDLVHKHQESLKSQVVNKLKAHNLKEPQNLKGGLSNIDFKDLLKPLNCSQSGSIVCDKSEKISNSDLEEFQSALARSCPDENITTVSRKLPRCVNNIRENKLARADSEDCSVSKTGSFKTARDELHAQNLKKYNTNSDSLNAGGQKRKLGIRRNVHSKFVPPLLSRNNSSSEELPKSEEWPTEIDERLKNIDPKMVELIKSEIMDVGATITWNDIAGLEFAKNSIQEAVVWPMLRPDIFTGLRRPPKGILLFGPPGTGKTLIGKCVASQSKSTFFSISASSLTSKWIGDGEKMVRALFAVARCHQPAVIFIDEIDSLLSQRSDSEHESSRRMKTEFLVQLDGATTDSEERILLIGATNRPQELDEAARRRFVKRLYIPLPDYPARLELVQKLVEKERHELLENDFEDIAKLSDGYSGADIRNLCAEASLGPIRSIDMRKIEQIQADDVRPLTMADFKKAFGRVRTSVSGKDLDLYIEWDQTYGSGL